MNHKQLHNCRVEIKVTVFLISVLISFNVLSETYVCSEELSKFGRPGEIQTAKFERMGDVFKRENITYQISLGSKSFLILTRLSTYNPPSLATIFIDKDTKMPSNVLRLTQK